MATARKKSTKRSPGKKGASKSPHATVQESVRNVVDEVEKTSEALLHQVKEQFEALGHRMSTAANSMADTASSVTETHVGSDVADFLSSAMNHVRETSEATAQHISEGFELLHERARAAATAAQKAAKKKPARKKATKKKASKRKTSKKKAAKKKASKKKTSRKKTAKKKASRKKPVRKKVSRKKAPRRRKTAR